MRRNRELEERRISQSLSEAANGIDVVVPDLGPFNEGLHAFKGSSAVIKHHDDNRRTGRVLVGAVLAVVAVGATATLFALSGGGGANETDAALAADTGSESGQDAVVPSPAEESDATADETSVADDTDRERASVDSAAPSTEPTEDEDSGEGDQVAEVPEEVDRTTSPVEQATTAMTPTTASTSSAGPATTETTTSTSTPPTTTPPASETTRGTNGVEIRVETVDTAGASVGGVTLQFNGDTINMATGLFVAYDVEPCNSYVFSASAPWIFAASGTNRLAMETCQNSFVVTLEQP